MSDSPTGLVDKLVKACFGILVATIALSCAMSVLKSTLPILIPVVGGGALVWLGIVVFRTWREKW